MGGMPILSARARLAGVIGWPVAHSRSPWLHNRWLEQHGIDGAYVPLPVAPGNFATAVQGLVACGFAGANVTLPHKEAAFAVCAVRDERAERAGAVNTLIFRDGLIEGRNTDGWGFCESVLAHGVDLVAGPALILGAGGSARAVAAALQEHGADVTVSNRTPERADGLARALGVRTLAWDAAPSALGDFALLVNATSLGMAGHPPVAFDLSAASDRLSVADLVYVPLETALLAAARARGLRAVDGLGMLLHQARAGFHAWFGVMPEVDAALYEAASAGLR
jgi:shikimate dehydrogenase